VGGPESRADQFQTFGVQVAFSDCDSSPTVQEKVMSNSTKPWEPLDPKRLTPAGLADRSAPSPPGRSTRARPKLAKAVSLKLGQKKQCAFDVPEVARRPGADPDLQGPDAVANGGGCSGPLRITVNVQGPSPKDNIANRPAQMTAIGGLTLSAWYDCRPAPLVRPQPMRPSRYPSTSPSTSVSYEYVLRLDNLVVKARPDRVGQIWEPVS